MAKIIEIRTERLHLRQWHRDDWLRFAQMNSDPLVKQYYPGVLNPQDSNEMAQKLATLISHRGWGLWAVELRDDNQFIGFVGLHEPTFILPVSPCVEIGWMLAKEYWGKGYATEAAQATLDIAFNKLGFKEVYSFTSVPNEKSQAVMKRLEMVNTDKNFQHPFVPKDNPLREHVLYKIDKQAWLDNNRKNSMS